MSRRVLVGFVIVNVIVSLAVALLVISYDNSQRAESEPLEGPTQIVILTATPLPGLDYQPAEYQATIDSLLLTGTALFNNSQVVAVVTATPGEDTSPGIEVPGVTPLATIDPNLLPPVPTDLPPGQPTATLFDDGCLRHVVESGDVPISIANQYGVLVGELLLANDLDENSIIVPGDVLIIPVEGCVTLNTPAPTSEPTNTPFPLTRQFATVTLPPTAVNAQISISTVLSPGDVNNEAIELRNQGDVLNLQGWTLTTPQGETYRFPEVRMQPESILRVYSRQGPNTPAALYWGRDTAAWSAGGRVTLSNSAGEVQAVFAIEG